MSKQAWLAPVVAAVVGLAAVPAAAQSSTHIKVSPGKGGKTTKFGVRFQAPESVGPGASSSEYVVSATGPSNKKGCVSSASGSVLSAQQGEMVHVTLKPGAGKKWCLGKFQGRVQRVIRPACGGCPPSPRSRGVATDAIACPLVSAIPCAATPARAQFIGVEPIGTFSFRVEKHPGRRAFQL